MSKPVDEARVELLIETNEDTFKDGESFISLCHSKLNQNMKKYVFLSCFLALVSISFAQESKKGLSLSLKSGIVFANMYGSDVESETFLNGMTPDSFYANHPASDAFKSGLNLGLLLDYRFSKYVSLGIGASYIEKGAKINANQHWSSTLQAYEDVKGDIYWNQNFWTIELPLTVYIPIKKDDIYFQVGLFKGFLIDSEEKGDIRISGQKSDYVNDRRANDSESGYFLTCGYIYALPDSKGSLFAELAWTRSLKSPGRDMIPNPQKYYNQTIGVNIGYRFAFSL